MREINVELVTKTVEVLIQKPITVSLMSKKPWKGRRTGRNHPLGRKY